MRVVALDIGEKRVGVAVSDPQGRVAVPVSVLETRRVLGDGTDLKRVLSDYDDVELIVIGLPLTMSGETGPQASRIRAAGEAIEAYSGIPVRYVDERLTSVEASRRMAEAGADSRTRRGSVDMVAASILLQSFLDDTPESR